MTQIFFTCITNHDIKTHFSIVNKELEKIAGNTLSLNIKKSKCTFFIKTYLKTTYLEVYPTFIFLRKVSKENLQYSF